MLQSIFDCDGHTMWIFKLDDELVEHAVKFEIAMLRILKMLKLSSQTWKSNQILSRLNLDFKKSDIRV